MERFQSQVIVAIGLCTRDHTQVIVNRSVKIFDQLLAHVAEVQHASISVDFDVSKWYAGRVLMKFRSEIRLGGIHEHLPLIVLREVVPDQPAVEVTEVGADVYLRFTLQGVDDVMAFISQQ